MDIVMKLYVVQIVVLIIRKNEKCLLRFRTRLDETGFK